MQKMGKRLGIYGSKVDWEYDCAQYEDSFTQLIKYMPVYKLDKEAKAHKFLGGLQGPDVEGRERVFRGL